MSKPYKSSMDNRHGKALMMDKWGSKSNYDSRGDYKKCDYTCLECPTNSPTTIREVLCSLTGEQIQVTTPFGPVTGTLIAVKCDYIVIIDETTGEQVLVRIEKISLVSPLRGGI